MSELSYVKLEDGKAKVTCLCGWESTPFPQGPFDPQEALVAARVDHMECETELCCESCKNALRMTEGGGFVCDTCKYAPSMQDTFIRRKRMAPPPMTGNEYQRLALRTEVTPDFINPAFIEERKARGADGGLDAKQLGRLIHAELGCCTETGESQDMVKKALIYGKPFDKVNVLEEAGDQLWYIALKLDACGYTMEQAMRANIEKLLKRFPQKFTEEAAINRDVDAERVTLEEHATK